MIVLFFGLVVITFVQLLFCQCKPIIAKLLPLGGVFTFWIWWLVNRNPNPGCGMGDAIMNLLLLLFLGGIALGWVIYGFQINGKNNKE